MKGSGKWTMLIVSGCLFFLLVSPSCHLAETGVTQGSERVEPASEFGAPLVWASDVYGRPGDVATISISINDVSDLFSWQVKLNWTNVYFNFLYAREGYFLRQGGSTDFIEPVVISSGVTESVTLACTRLGSALGYLNPCSSPTSGVLATVAVYIVAPVNGSLFDLFGIELRDSDMLPIDASAQDGRYFLSRDWDIRPQGGVVDTYDLSEVGLSYGTNMVQVLKTPTQWAVAGGSGWGNPEAVCVSDNLRASEAFQNDATYWTSFLFNSSGWTDVDKVEVGLERRADSGTRDLLIELSNDNGTSWSSTSYARTISDLSDTLVWIDVTDAYDWSPADAENIAVKLTCLLSSANAIKIDYLAIRLTPTPLLPQPQTFNPHADLNADRTVNIEDLLRVKSNFGSYAFAQPLELYTPNPYDSRPTSQIFTEGVKTIADASRAYDSDNSTFTTWTYTRLPTFGGQDGYIEFAIYSPTNGPPRGSHITQVDLKVVYRVATQASTDATLELTYLVGSSSEQNLRGPVREPSGWHNLTWSNSNEPNDGSWSWEDVSTLKFRFKRNDPATIDSGGLMHIYEIWAVICYESTQQVAVFPRQQFPIPTTLNINVSGVEELYGFEFRLTYNTTAVTVTEVVLGPFLNNTAGGSANTYGALIDLNDTAGFAWAAQSIVGNARGGNVPAGSWMTLATIGIVVDAGGPSNLDFEIKLVGHNYILKKTYPMAFTLNQPKHDAAVIGVAASSNNVTRGETVNVNATLANQGDYLETCYVTMYLDAVPLETKIVSNLELDANATILYNWDTHEYASSNYTITVEVAITATDFDQVDNTATGPEVKVNPLFGDIDEDGWVDNYDLVLLTMAYGSRSGDSNWNINADLNRDDVIDVKDLRLLGKAWDPGH